MFCPKLLGIDELSELEPAIEVTPNTSITPLGELLIGFSQETSILIVFSWFCAFMDCCSASSASGEHELNDVIIRTTVRGKSNLIISGGLIVFLVFNEVIDIG